MATTAKRGSTGEARASSITWRLLEKATGVDGLAKKKTIENRQKKVSLSSTLELPFNQLGRSTPSLPPMTGPLSGDPECSTLVSVHPDDRKKVEDVSTGLQALLAEVNFRRSKKLGMTREEIELSLPDISLPQCGLTVIDEDFSRFGSAIDISVVGNEISALQNIPKSARSINADANKLASIDNIVHLPLLNLSASWNKLERIVPASVPPSLVRLDLSFNKITAFADIQPICDLPNLRSLHFEGNPISFVAGYRLAVIRMRPELDQLDGVSVTDEERGQALEDSSAKEPGVPATIDFFIKVHTVSGVKPKQSSVCVPALPKPEAEGGDGSGSDGEGEKEEAEQEKRSLKHRLRLELHYNSEPPLRTAEKVVDGEEGVIEWNACKKVSVAYSSDLLEHLSTFTVILLERKPTIALAQSEDEVASFTPPLGNVYCSAVLNVREMLSHGLLTGSEVNIASIYERPRQSVCCLSACCSLLGATPFFPSSPLSPHSAQCLIHRRFTASSACFLFARKHSPSH
uniref:Uncharacterized protein n=1 Tax=Palpitomonas bilix TaxID=652834 RepID=A0A7S3FZ81_9EUKA|mmetsp:Transcript_15575/g.39477  ORF Transcript_15575/g.39477 Transcript_15575/m.39477 type:complete len:517 (+) Transcript_15575:205-1755(+)